MPFLWTGYLSARHDFWPRPLSVDTLPTVTTCKANTGKTPRFLRFTEPCDKCGVDQLAMTGRPAVEHDRRPGRCGKPRPVALPRPAGQGASKLVRNEKYPVDGPRVRELAVLSALAALGCGLAAVQGDPCSSVSLASPA